MGENRIIEKLLRQLSSDHDEKARLREQLDSLLAETARLNDAAEKRDREREKSEKAFMKTILNLNKRLEKMAEALMDRDRRIASLELQVKQQRGKRFSPTSEQKRLLNGRLAADDREKDKDQFDGTSAPGSAADTAANGNGENGNAAGESSGSTKKKAGKAKPKSSCLHGKLYAPEPDGAATVEETVMHRLEDYYTLPEGARFWKRGDGTGIYYYTRIERIPERIVKHVYEVASVIMPDDSIVQTMDTPHIAGKCPLSPALMAWILVEKYVYHAPVNTVKKKLRAAGYTVSKSVLGRYYHQGMQVLVDLLQDTFHAEVRKAGYLMIDETAELVGVTDKETGGRSYLKKYLWAFFDKAKGLVAYVYEHGSRARKVVLDFLQNFFGYISTDGYVAYSIFDDEEKYPDIIRAGCWTHTRRMYVEALESERKECTTMINNIGRLFAVEIKAVISGMDIQDRRNLRERESIPILHEIKEHLRNLAANPAIMANDAMKKAVNYMQNQWTALKTYITSGQVEISNNLCEQRMKTIKLTLKNCQNIGSEAAAERSAFLQSLVESCTLNRINPLEYITSLFELIYKGEKTTDKVSLLPCYWGAKC